MTENVPQLLPFFKALADETRLEMAGLLARKALSGQQLAAQLGIKPATVSHHLAKLTEAGLVTARTEGHSKFYSLRLDVMHETAKQLLPKESVVQPIEDIHMAPYDTKVVKDFSNPDGSLKRIPAQRKKLIVVLRHILREFEPARQYTEKQVNEILAHFHADTASLRRAMIDCQLMKREAGKYWRYEAPAST